MNDMVFDTKKFSEGAEKRSEGHWILQRQEVTRGSSSETGGQRAGERET